MLKPNIPFKIQAGEIAPDSRLVKYWVDLKEDPSGKTVKVYDTSSNGWVKANNGGSSNAVSGNDQSVAIDISFISDLELIGNTEGGAVFRGTEEIKQIFRNAVDTKCTRFYSNDTAVPGFCIEANKNTDSHTIDIMFFWTSANDANQYFQDTYELTYIFKNDTIEMREAPIPWPIVTIGDGTKFLADDAEYKTIPYNSVVDISFLFDEQGRVLYNVQLTEQQYQTIKDLYESQSLVKIDNSKSIIRALIFKGTDNDYIIAFHNYQLFQDENDPEICELVERFAQFVISADRTVKGAMLDRPFQTGGDGTTFLSDRGYYESIPNT